MRVKITAVDHAPDELYDQTPFEAVLVREIPGRGYWVAALPKPIRWSRNGVATSASQLILEARWVGTRIVRGMNNMPVNIASVVDESVWDDAWFDFGKCEYLAMGLASEIPGDA